MAAKNRAPNGPPDEKKKREPGARTPIQAEPLPPDGPWLYISCAAVDVPRRRLTEVANVLRRRGIRAQLDVLEIGDREERRASPEWYARAIERSEWVVILITEEYLARARAGRTGVNGDLDAIEERALREPSLRNRVLPFLLDGAVGLDATNLEPLTFGLRVVAGRRDSTPEHVADLIQTGMRAVEEPAPSTLGLDRPWLEHRSKLVDGVLTRAANIASGHAPDALSIDALLAAMLIEGNSTNQHDSASWLWSRLADAGEDSFNRFLASRFPLSADAGRASKTRLRRDSSEVNHEVSSVLAWASFLARATGADGIHGVHLLLAILHTYAPWSASVDRSLTQIGIRPELVRERLAADLHTWGVPGARAHLDLWRSGATTTITTVGPAPRWKWSAAAGIPSLYGGGDEDRLDITPDVEAFAKVLASWELEPPLSIGLFGDWGSGKTFFMNRLKKEIEALSKAARADKVTPQKDLTYCKYVVQVEFNAWHYSEGDLWACLVDHIFTNLRLNDDESASEVAKRRKVLLSQLQATEAAGKDADARKTAADEALKHADDEVKEAEKKLEAAQQQFTALSVKDIWTAVMASPELQKEVKTLLESVGIDTKNKNTAAELEAAIEDAKSLGGRTKQVWDFLRAQSRNPWAYLAFAVALGVPAVLAWLATWLPGEAAKTGAAVTAVLSAVAGFLPIYRTFASRVRDVVDQLEKPRRMAEEARRVELDGLQKKIERLTAERNDAAQYKKDIEGKKTALESALKGLNADRMLADFLQDRAASDDYRKRLGTLALIRRDFERLANLMKSQRDDENKGIKPTDGVPPDLRVHRIVLYIDDLDRCAPKQVVEVLQAIHLLLAFPLFVVVVGVDARWVHRSIRHQYRELLTAEGDGNGNPSVDAADRPEEEEMHATPRDYLEKIFQVPFWLNPMGIPACRNLMDGILKGASAQETESAAVPPQTAPPAAQTPGEPQTGSGGQSAPPSSVPTPAPPTAEKPPATPPKETGSIEKPPPPAVKPAALLVTADELELMKRLAPIVGRSPRAVKRFINCYRLFKAVVPEQGVEEFVAGAAGQTPLTSAELSLFFLATIVGAPGVSLLMRDAMHRVSATETLDSLREDLSDRIERETEAAQAEWRTIDPVLEALAARAGPRPLADFTTIADRAWRFSFRSGMQPVESAKAAAKTA